MFSVPPANIISASPALMAWAANATVFNPDPQTLFTVNDGTSIGIPVWTATCLATFWPRPAPKTFPNITSSTCDGSTLALFNASLAAIVPSCTAETSLNTPP